MSEHSNGNLVEVQHLKKYFPIRKGVLSREVARVHAVDDVTLSVAEGETLGLVGESGCGKSTLGRCIVRLLEPTAGEVVFDGREIGKLGARSLRPLRREMQMIFQDPYASLNPRKRVGTIIGDPMRIHGIGDRKRAEAGASRSCSSTVGLSPEHYNRFPHEFSGGQRQRIGVARALALRPKLIVADEPVSALDVSIQAQMVNLLEELQDEFGLTYLFIAHDLGVVRHVSDRIAVMYLGKLVELSPAEELYTRPIMPYTEALLSAVPDPGSRPRREAGADRARRATCRARSTRPRDAASTRAAATRPTSARRSSRRSWTTATGISRLATIRSMWTRRRSPASRPRRRTRRRPQTCRRCRRSPARKSRAR